MPVGESFPCSRPAPQRRELSLLAGKNRVRQPLTPICGPELAAMAQQAGRGRVPDEVDLPSARADEIEHEDGFIHFESDLRPYPCKIYQLTQNMLMDLLPGFEGAGLTVHKGEATRRGRAPPDQETAHEMPGRPGVY